MKNYNNQKTETVYRLNRIEILLEELLDEHLLDIGNALSCIQDTLVNIDHTTHAMLDVMANDSSRCKCNNCSA